MLPGVSIVTKWMPDEDLRGNVLTIKSAASMNSSVQRLPFDFSR